ncbi:unnamed protein product [Allacma fusca]|uniref:Enkurin domain-containing protein n=1 Tax=Allacma fusca TaxID=39272 RepID=A0A8J2LMR9_9HEXA|nr:unnamed protein product [Allacma fusca]
MATTKPPYYWKVPSALERDYMYENVQRIRRTAAQNKSREPMKAAFIPGVTKNAKYAHVTSRVSEFLRQPNLGGTGDMASLQGLQGATRSRSSLSTMSNNSQSKPRVSIPEQRGMPVNRRLSRSSTDLASMTKQKTGYTSTATSAPPGQQRGITVDGPGNYIPRARRKPPGLQVEDESVYNWRFSDNSTPTNFFNSAQNPKIKTFHRVEYLPCDGICADETVEDHGCNGSGRSSSRTSRGMNTEETRIIQDMQEMQLSSPRSQSVENLADVNKGTMTYGNWKGSQKNPEPVVMKNISARNNNTNFRSTNVTSNNVGTGTELPHSLGTVPKYLKQRQDEWKTQADQAAAAASAADVPPGHVLLSEQERVETLQELKSKYSMLINELNRVPIRIDTMRVREHKIQLEQQLQKLERGMAIFSRSRVFVKLPESGPVGEIPSRVAI